MNKDDTLAAYRDFTKWCRDNPSLDLDSRPHSHGGPIGDGGYISDEKTRVAFAAWRAAIEADRKRRGGPVAWVSEQLILGQTVAGRHRRVWWECNEGVGFPIYRDAQPAEPVKHPSYESDCCQGHKPEPECKCAIHDAEPEKPLPELVVTKDGIPFEDQNEAIRQFKEACMAAADLEAKQRATATEPVKGEPSPADRLRWALRECGVSRDDNGAFFSEADLGKLAALLARYATPVAAQPTRTAALIDAATIAHQHLREAQQRYDSTGSSYDEGASDMADLIEVHIRALIEGPKASEHTSNE